MTSTAAIIATAAGRTIRCVATTPQEEEEEDVGPQPLFLGRDDGTIEKYHYIQDADLGKPALILRGHRKPVTGLVVLSPEEVVSCSLDCTVRQWNAEETEADRAPLHPAGTTALVEPPRRFTNCTNLPCGLRCIARYDGRYYAGGEDGALCVVDGTTRTAVWPGHRGPLRCIAFSGDGLAVTGGDDNQLRVWDLSSGNTVRLLIGHSNPVIGVAVIPGKDGDDDEDLGGAGGYGSGLDHVSSASSVPSIVSFALDSTMKVWAVPDPADPSATEVAALIEEDHARRAVVSFQEPKATSENAEGEDGAGGEDGQDTAAAAVPDEAGDTGKEAGGNGMATTPPPSRPTARFADTIEEVMADDAATPNAAASAAAAAAMAAAGVAAKSALKVREKPVIRHDDPLGTYELPECPYSLFQPDLHLLPPSPSLLTFVGSANGVVIGLYTQRLATAVLRFVAANRTKVRLEVRGTNQTVKKAAALFTKECAAAVKKETKRLQRLARQTRREAAEKAKEEQRVARAAARAQARANAAADSEDDEQQEEEEAYEQEEEEEEEEGEEEEETEGEDGQDTEDNNADTGALRYLSDEQRAELKTFVEAREKERDDKIAALTSAATAHLAKVEPLALTPYIRTGEQLLQQKSVTFGRAGKETVLGVVAAVGGRVYAAQSDHVVPVDVALGMLKLA